jgi:surface polysaccharide O-acyltransferase-like enzyme
MGQFSERNSEAFKIANLIAIFLIVAIHYNSKHYIDTNSALSLNYYVQEWFTNSIARIAVPFFGFAAGFFYFLNFKRISEYWLQLSKRGWSLLVPYTIAVSVVFFN